jgi:hypothetical protein
MLGAEILLYLDTGPDFFRALKLAVLYEKRVHVLTLLDQRLIASFLDALPDVAPQPVAPQLRVADPVVRVPILGGGVPVPSTPNMADYLRFVQQHREELDLLVSEGLLTSDFPQGFAFGGTFRADAKILRVLERWPPSYWDFAQSLPLGAQERVAAFQGHLCFIAMIAQQAGLGLGTWSWDFQEALWTSVQQLAEGGPISAEPTPLATDAIGQRHLVETGLAHTVLERYVPRVDDLPVVVILELKRRYAAELGRFHEGLRQLATQVDLSQAPARISGQLQDLATRHVDPAVKDLEQSLGMARWDFLKKLATKEPIAAGIGLGIAGMTGVPFDVGALLKATGAAVAVAAAETVVDRKKAFTTSQWSILFRLTKLQRTKPERAPLSIAPRA